MSVERAVRERWGAYAPLTSLVPLTQLVTGWMPAADAEEPIKPPVSLPFVSMVRQGTPQSGRTSSGTSLETVLETLNIWADNLGEAKQIADAVFDYFDNADFPWSRGAVLCMRESNRREAQETDGMWNIPLDYLIRISTTAGT